MTREASGNPLTSPAGAGLLTGAACAGIFVWGSIATLLGSILPTLSERVGLTLDQAGQMFLANGAGLVVASLIGGPLIDIWGKKRILLAGFLLVVGSLLLFTQAETRLALFALAFTLGAGGSALVTAANAAVSDLYTERRESALNLLNFFFGFGAFVTPFAIVPLQRYGGLSTVLVTVAAITLVALLFSSFLRFPAPLRGATWAFAETGQLLATGRFLALGGILFLYVGVEASIWNWQVTLMIDRFGTDRFLAARVLSGFAVTLMLGRLISNRVLLAVPPGRLLLVSTGVGTLLLGLAHNLPNFTGAVVSFCGAGFFLASIFPTGVGLLGRHFPRLSGTATGLGITCAWLGAMVVPPAVGYAGQQWGLQKGVLVILLAAIAMFILSVVVVSSRREATAES